MRLVIAELKNCCWFALIQKGIHLTLIGIFMPRGCWRCIWFLNAVYRKTLNKRLLIAPLKRSYYQSISLSILLWKQMVRFYVAGNFLIFNDAGNRTLITLHIWCIVITVVFLLVVFNWILLHFIRVTLFPRAVPSHPPDSQVTHCGEVRCEPSRLFLCWALHSGLSVWSLHLL